MQGYNNIDDLYFLVEKNGYRIVINWDFFIDVGFINYVVG